MKRQRAESFNGSSDNFFFNESVDLKNHFFHCIFGLSNDSQFGVFLESEWQEFLFHSSSAFISLKVNFVKLFLK